MRDPNPQVNGRGIALLGSKGIAVTEGMLEEEIRRQNEVFIKVITTGIPFVVLKTAMTLDGKTATVTNASRWITGEESRRIVHRMRQQYGAVLVGADTVIFDDPVLNIRLRRRKDMPYIEMAKGSGPGKMGPEGTSSKQYFWKNPLKVVADTRARVPLEAKIFTNDPQLTILATTDLAPAEKLKQIERAGAQVLVCPAKEGRVDLGFVIRSLGRMEVDSVMIEGGSRLAFSALKEKLVDKVVTFVAPLILGGETAPTPVGGEGIPVMDEAIGLENMRVKRTGKDLLLEAYI
jgi:diaminohydroxyphosphoribosylaminopyrimidine deaminase/5-amino-6-(5-phosphoribosylamino)uracil reductase